MKRISELLAIPAIVSLIGLMLWGEYIKEFNVLLYHLMIVVLVGGFFSVQVQTRLDRNREATYQALAKYKKENNIP
jgi:hypothetical protein